MTKLRAELSADVIAQLVRAQVTILDDEIRHLRDALERAPSIWHLRVYAARAAWARSIWDVIGPAPSPKADLIALRAGVHEWLDRMAVVEPATIPSKWALSWIDADGEERQTLHGSIVEALDAALDAGWRLHRAVGDLAVAACRAVPEWREDLAAWREKPGDAGRDLEPSIRKALEPSIQPILERELAFMRCQ